MSPPSRARIADRSKTPRFWSSLLGRHVQLHRVRVLEVAAFLAPSDAAVRRALFEARWDERFRSETSLTYAQRWDKYRELSLVARLSRPSANDHDYRFYDERARSLEHVFQALADFRTWEELRPYHGQALQAADFWARDILEYEAEAKRNPELAAGYERYCESRIEAVGSTARNSSIKRLGAVVGMRMLDKAWPALAPAFARVAHHSTSRGLELGGEIASYYFSVGEEDRANARLHAAMAALNPADLPVTPEAQQESLRRIVVEALNPADVPELAALTLRAFHLTRPPSTQPSSVDYVAPPATPRDQCARWEKIIADRLRATGSAPLANIRVHVFPAAPAPASSPKPSDPPAINPGWTRHAPASPTAGVGSGLERALPVSPRTLYWWAAAGWSRSEILSVNRVRSSPPGCSRLVGFDGARLWIDEVALSSSGRHDLKDFRVTSYSPFGSVLDPHGRKINASSRFVGAAFHRGNAFLASEFDGLYRLDASGATTHVTPDKGLPSLKLTAITAYESGVAVAAAPPERLVSYLNVTTGEWRDVPLPEALAADGQTSLRAPGPVLAGAGKWLLLGEERPRLYNTSTRRWDVELSARQNPAEDWARVPPLVAIGDATTFWLGGRFGLVQLDPEKPSAPAQWERCPPVYALADDGPWLWALMDGPGKLGPQTLGERVRHKRVALYDKAARRWLGFVNVPDGAFQISAGQQRLWALGNELYEYDLTSLREELGRAPIRLDANVDDLAARWSGKPSTLLHQAAGLGDVAAVRRLLAAGVDTNVATSSGWTPLHAAAAASQLDAAEVLLTAKANLKAVTSAGDTPLALAASAGSLELVRAFLRAGAQPSYQTRAHAASTSMFGDPLLQGSPDKPSQPTRLLCEPLPDGRARLRWEPPAGPRDGYVIYRHDDPPAKIGGLYRRWVRYDPRRWVNLGERIALAGPDAVSWIDEYECPPGTTSTYSVVAVNPNDREGPYLPTARASLANPPKPAPALQVYDHPPIRRDRTPLHHAAAAGHTAIVAELLAAGADPGLVNQRGATALHFAIQAGRHDAAVVLIKGGAPLEAAIPAEDVELRVKGAGPVELAYEITSSHVTALGLVYAAHGDEPLYQTLLAAGANPLTAFNGPLAVLAARLGHKEDVRSLLARAPHPFVSDIGGATAFTAALQTGRLQLARDLRDACYAPADPRWPAGPGRDHAPAEVALRAAIEAKDQDSLVWLLERGADSKSFKDRSPLELAISTQNMEAARRLLEAGATTRGVSPHYLASVQDPTVKALLAANAEGNAVPPAPTAERSLKSSVFPWRFSVRASTFGPQADSTPDPRPKTKSQAEKDQRLSKVAAAGDLGGISAALAEGAAPASVDENNWTPLIHALAAKKVAAARLLIDAGAPLNRTTRSGSAPLAFAVNIGDRALVVEMIELGADPNLAVGDSSTPLDIAVVEHPALISLLVNHGADVRALVPIGGTTERAPPLYRSALLGELERVRLLVSFGASPVTPIWRNQQGTTMLPLTPLPFAAASNDLPTLNYFLALGLDPTKENAHGDNALDSALLSNASLTAAKLRALGVKTRVERGLPSR